MAVLRPNSHRAKIAIAMIWATAITQVLAFIGDYVYYNWLAGMHDVSEDDLYILIIVIQILSMVSLMFNILSAVTFIRWFRRAYYNLHQQVDGLSYSDGWAAASWFVPVLNLYRPYIIMKELFEETNHILVAKGFGTTDRLSVQAVAWWWTLWIICLLFSIATSVVLFSTDDFSVSRVEFFMMLFSILLAYRTVKIIQEYASVEPLTQELELGYQSDSDQRSGRRSIP